MTLRQRLLPHPVTSLVLVTVWLLLNHSVSAGHVVLGAALGWLIPLFTQRFFPEPVYLGRAGVLVRFLAVVLWDIVVANFSVARLALAPVSRLRPGFVRVPVDVEDDFALTALANTISLTPGTVSAQITPDRRHILVHALDLGDESALVNTIKARYEAPLKEIFKC